MPDPAALPVNASCPRCGAAFHCGVHDDRPCVCTTVTLGADRLAALQRGFDGCLCIACLHTLAAAEPPVSSA